MDRDIRKNDLLDEMMEEIPGGGKTTAKRRRKRRASALNRDAIKRRAFRILAIIADLEAKDRRRVLRMAETLSGS